MKESVLIERINKIEDNITVLETHNTRILSSINLLVSNVKDLNKSVEITTDSCGMLYEKVKLLEQDLQERSIRKKVMKSLMTFYPLVIIVLLILTDLSHKRIADVAEDVNKIIPLLTKM